MSKSLSGFVKLAAAVAVVSGLVGGLGGCANAPTAPVYGDLTFDDKPPIRLLLSNVQVVNSYELPDNNGHIETRLPVSLSRSMARWAKDRLKPIGGQEVGSPDTLVFNITEASMRETALPHKKGFRADFTDEQAYRYDGDLSAVLEIRDVHGVKVASAEGHVSRSATVLESASLLDKERLWYDMTKAMMADLDKVLTDNMAQYMRRYISYE